MATLPIITYLTEFLTTARSSKTTPLLFPGASTTTESLNDLRNYLNTFKVLMAVEIITINLIL
jgi:hypothetical protein